MKVLLSIKPEYVQKIFNGSKRFEFRKTAFSKKIDTVVVYATAPVKKVVGEFRCDTILSNNPDEIWKLTSQFAGISKDKYDAYFGDCHQAHALVVSSPKLYDIPKPLKELNIKTPPQSFLYIN